MSEHKKEFPFFNHNPDVHYLDSSASTLRPNSVIHKVVEYYEQYPVNVHRGLYTLSEKATKNYEGVREVVAAFINARPEEIIFTKNATEGINGLAQSIGKQLSEGDEIITTVMEHHSNFLPWQRLAVEKKLKLTMLGVAPDGMLSYDVQGKEMSSSIEKLDRIISKKTKVLALTHVSNVLGTINPVGDIIQRVRAINPSIIVVVDGCQSVPHMPVDVRVLDPDFMVFSGYKMLGPTGVGIVYGKKEKLASLDPWMYGGEMVQTVSLDGAMFKEAPQKFEAGTPNIAGVIGFGEAVSFLEKMSMDKVRQHEVALIEYAVSALSKTFGEDIHIVGPRDSQHRSAGIAFTFKTYHPHDIASLLDEKSVCVRAGQHCAMPLHTALSLHATVRASFYVYTTKQDVDALIEGLIYVDHVLKK